MNRVDTCDLRTPIDLVFYRLRLALICLACLANLSPASLSAQIGAAAVGRRQAAINEQEAVQFADSLSLVILQADIEAYNKLVDWNAIFDKATRLPESAELQKSRDDFKRGGMTEMARSGSIAAQINLAIKKGGTYKCIRVDVNDKTPYVMFRLKLPNGGGVNYHQLFIERAPAGNIIATDMFVFLSAEKISETFRRAWLPVAKQQLKSDEEKLKNVDPLLASLDKFLEFTNLVTKDKFVEALELYRQLPEEVQKDKNALLVRLRAAQAVSEDEYRQVIEDFRKFHPNDIALDFILIDGYTILKQYDRALACIEKTNKNVGGDPMLLVLRANLLILMKRIPEARKSVEDAIAAEPELVEAYSSGLDVSLAHPDFDETVKYLDALEKQFGYKWKDLREVPVFSEFVKSPQYLEWAKTQK